MNRTEIYKNGFSWPLLFSTIPIIIISIPGILTNIVLICVTIKNKALHGTTNFLLAQLAFYEIIHETGYFVVLYCNLIGLNSLTYSKASRLFSVPLFTVFGISPLMAFTGIDRLLYVIFSISFPKKVNPTIYLGVYTFICVIYCGLMTAGLIWFNDVNPDLVISALLSDVLTVESFYFKN
uniref:Uncharacterized protein n=1 Tax=Meloidogyne enterolobii TaxID=390850 RepID=A0A6V7WFM0_MELEN|nr:unnamed protein product [Meloidogyne enterolobii]